MAISVRSRLSEEERIFTVAVDRRGEDGVDGMLFHGASHQGWHFGSFLEMTEVVEQILGQIHYPGEVMKKRFFGRARNRSAEQKKCGEKLAWREGAEGTYLLRIRHRQNASWQGTLYDRKNGQRFAFHSFLELVEYLDSGMAAPDMQREERCRQIIERYLPLVLTDSQSWPCIQEILPTVAVCQVFCGGRRNTFLLRLMFFEHHACQGVLYWKERNCQQSFRSFLELVQLIGEAARDEEEWEESAG